MQQPTQRIRFACLITAAAMAALVPAAAAQVERSLSGAEWIAPRVAGVTKRNPDRHAVLDQMEALYRQSEADGVPGISQQDYDLAAQMDATARRKAFLEANWLPFDLDGDGIVTRREIDSVARLRAVQQLAGRGIALDPTPEQVDEMKRLLAERILGNYGPEADDITLQDAIAAAERTNVAASSRSLLANMVPLALDGNSDGTVSLDEFRTSVGDAFAMIDTNRDDVASKEELAAAGELVRSLQMTMNKIRAQEAKREAERAAQEALKTRTANCGFPVVAADEKLILISTNSALGRGLATIVLDDSGHPVVVVQVKVEPGPEELVVAVTSSRRTIWRFSGAVGRVARVVVGSGKALRDDPRDMQPAGVTGIDAARVVFMASSDCLPYFEDESEKHAKLPQWVVAQVAGRAPDRVAAAGRLGTIFVPSLRIDNDASYEDALTLPGTGDVAALYALFLDYYPAGVIDLDPASVVSTGRAERLDSLPANAGLAQLLDAGALEVTGYDLHYHVGRHRYIMAGTDRSPPLPDGVTADVVQRIPGRFLIKQKIQFPVGFCDELSLKFVVARGVPVPALRACYPAILVEDTGETLCKGDRRPCRQ